MHRPSGGCLFSPARPIILFFPIIEGWLTFSSVKPNLRVILQCNIEIVSNFLLASSRITLQTPHSVPFSTSFALFQSDLIHRVSIASFKDAASRVTLFRFSPFCQHILRWQQVNRSFVRWESPGRRKYPERKNTIALLSECICTLDSCICSYKIYNVCRRKRRHTICELNVIGRLLNLWRHLHLPFFSFVCVRNHSVLC